MTIAATAPTPILARNGSYKSSRNRKRSYDFKVTGNSL
jgi:hypothetical protein